VRTISVLGGEPTLHAHTLVELAAAADGPLSLALNTNLYATPEALALLDGVAGLYVVDLKFGQDECAQRLAGVPHYLDAIRRNLCWIARRTPFLVRHLLLPGHLECCLRPLANWLAAELPGCRFQLYTGVVPCWQAAAVGLGRLNTRAEARAAVEHLRALPLEWKSGCDGTT
jgi:putative pyruvate formate lyase activating enzyme